jgi:hypothetical protein
MTRRKTTAQQSSSRKEFSPTRQPPVSGVLNRLTSAEAKTVLRLLLERHPELHREAEQIASDVVSSSSVEDVAGRGGRIHSGGVDPILPAAGRQTVFQRLVETLVCRLPEWEDIFRRIAERSVET